MITVFNYFADEIQYVPGRLRDTDKTFRGRPCGYKYLSGENYAPEYISQLSGGVIIE